MDGRAIVLQSIPAPSPAPSVQIQSPDTRDQSDLEFPILPDPSQRIGDYQEWGGIIYKYYLRDSNDPVDAESPNAEVMFVRDDSPAGSAFPVFVAQGTVVGGAPLQCVATDEDRLKTLQGYHGMCKALPESIVLGKTHVRMRIWLQVARLDGRLLLLPSTNRIDIIP